MASGNHRHAIMIGALLPFIVIGFHQALGRAEAFDSPPGSETTRNGRTLPAGVDQPKTPTLFDARELWLTGAYDRAAEVYAALADAARSDSDAPGADPSLAEEAKLGLARCRLQVGKYDAGLEGLLKADLGDSADWHELLAQFHRRKGDYGKTLVHSRAAFERNPNHAAARHLFAETLEYLGRRDEAVEAFRWFDQKLVGGGDLPSDSEELTHLAVGFLRYSVLTQTNVAQRTQHALQQMLQMAYGRLDRFYWPARVAAADLLRERYNNDEIDGSISDYQAALRINPNLPQAHVGLGEVALEGWQFEVIEDHVGKALAINPNFAPALHLWAKKLILERRYEQAREPSERALAINPNDLVAISLLAAASACRYDDKVVESLAERVARINPRCALFHRTLGDAIGGIRQYAASEKEYKKAIELDPTDANARTELGMMYMQWGLEDAAREALDAAWVLDRYNQRTKFTLDLLDSLHEFARKETPNFLIRHDATKDPGLGEYVADYLEPIYDVVTGDYRMPLEDKTIVEFFPTHRSFAVRITGKPWIHTVGACTGRVIALATPRESVELMGRYNLDRVITHEFTHTVTLAATNNRIPHWFTEGLAVYQEDAPRNFDWMELLADAVRHGRLFTLESIDWGFIRPKRPTDRTMAYAQSEWMSEYIIERFGYDAIRAMLDGFRDGKTQAEVFLNTLKLSTGEFDRDFAVWAREQAGKWGFDLSPPGDLDELRRQARSEGATAEVLGQLAKAELDDYEPDQALSVARRALQQNPSERNALEVIVRLLSAQASQMPESVRPAVEQEILPAIDKLLEADPENWIGLKSHAEILLRREDWNAAKPVLERLQEACPADPFSWRALAAIHLQNNDDDSAFPHLAQLARIEQNDPGVPGKLAQILRQRGNLREAQYWYRQALAIDPFDVSLHEALGGLCLEIGDNEAALREYKMLSRLQPRNAKHFERAAIAAHRSGDPDTSRVFAERAVALDPNSPARNLLKN